MANVQIDGIDFYYEEHGSGDALVFVHGLGSSTRDWERQQQVFSQTHRVILVDMRGHGRSTKPPGPYSIARMSEDLHELIQILEISHCHLIGISMGAMIALQCALDHPEGIESVVAVNTPPSMRPVGIKQHLMVLQRKLLVSVFGMKKVGEVLAGRLFPDPDHQALRETFASRWAENDIDAYRASFNAILQWDISDRLPSFKPTLLIVAADQDYLPLDSKKVFTEKIDNASLIVIENSRHATPVERPEAFNEALKVWLVTCCPL